MLNFSFILLLFLITICECKFKITFMNVTGVANPDHLILTVSMRNESNESIVDLVANLTTQIGSTLFLSVEIQTKISDTDYETLAKTDNLDLCVLLESAKAEPVVIPFLENIGKHGNIPQSCPIDKGVYYLEGYKLNSDALPAFTPTGNFRIILNLTYQVEEDIAKELCSMQWDSKVEII